MKKRTLMQRTPLKVGIVVGLFLIIQGSGFNAARAAKKEQHISNRIEIAEPERQKEKGGASQKENATSPEGKQNSVGVQAETQTVSGTEKSGSTRSAEGGGKKEGKQNLSALEKGGGLPKRKALPLDRAVSSTKKEGNESVEQGALDLIGKKEQYYVRKGKPDPFAPFISGPEPQSQTKQRKKLQRREPRTPLERISLGQLRLTAVMETGEQNLALVEEASGKGYVVKEGTYIGTEGGRITDILSEAIVVEEKYLDVFGNVAVRKKQLKLQK
jgi:type IV pilus assembly protein PilP